MPPVISVQNLGKKYILSHQSPERYTALRDVIANGAKRTLKKILHPFAAPEGDETREEFWALKDVTFDIQQGDRIGIIGRNGAGKSTLLKILSRITEPTTGQVRIRGRVASLLEVGTGFHPELTGRENIFLNGAILGMSMAEIKKKFDEIVAFAEVVNFLDTPVKRYSSGMYVRLAFAVAAHLEPEILIVDEVLAVGDLQFQRKCLGKMESITHNGERTILFVSHNMHAIKQLCNKVICIEKGQIGFEGIAHEGINFYYKRELPNAFSFADQATSTHITKVNFLNESLSHQARFDQREKLIVEILIKVLKPYKNLNVSMAIIHGEIGPIFSESLVDYCGLKAIDSGFYSVRFTMDLHYFKLEQYYLTIHLVDLETGEVPNYVLNVPLPEIYNEKYDYLIESKRWGIIRLPIVWKAMEKI